MFISKKLKKILFNYRNGITKWTCVNCVRAKSSAKPETKIYSHTILTPKTSFPARSSNAIKEEIYETAKFSELYNWQRENLKGREFVLHDGPPYANGDLHMGHAVNKIIKDINNRSQVLQGNKVHYIPGWDCHGLPIELKALQKAKKSLKDANFTDPVHVRNIAKKFALETVERQKEAFRSWGVMADWENQCYLTLNKSYVQNQLRLFYEMYNRGYIYRALKPVYWSPSSKTALAEAELEYDPQYKSTEVYATFDIDKPSDFLNDKFNGKPMSAIVWTTTPWTLVANRAICYNPKMKYAAVELSSRQGLFVVASALIEDLESVLGVHITKILEFDGVELSGATYSNRLVGGSLPFLEGGHVTQSRGTGLVHTAPAHGPEDFLVALDNDVAVECNVDESGRYSDLDPDLNGLQVLDEGQEAVITRLGDSVIHRGVYTHSYPLDWRTKKPVIIRASRQWFIDTAKLKDKALAALDKVAMLPAASSAQSRLGFRSQLEKRPYWCISRQRAWGVPIPALYTASDVIVDRSVVEKLCDLVEAHGADIWWTCDVEQLITDEVKNKYKLVNGDAFKGKDIMDIWLDSGLTWSTLGGRTADLYSEGVDQLTGWFQASLLTSIALKDAPPYKSIFVHGFVVDEKKRKMSKSIGNIIEPATIIHGGKDKHNQPAYGVDTLRWWVAGHATQHAQIIISKKLLDDCQTEIIRVRNIMRYLLSVISDVNKADFYRKPKLNYFDSYMVKETENFTQQVVEHYDNFRYNHAAQSILYFISNKVSGLYCHCVKDRLYCNHKDSEDRLSAQLVIHTILVSLCNALGPILPHLIEEVWQHHPLFEKPFYFTTKKPVLPAGEIDISTMDAILDIKRDICASARNENLQKLSAVIKTNSCLYDKLDGLEKTGVLCEILELSSVKLTEVSDVDRWEVEVSQSLRGRCLRCRRYTVTDGNQCARCQRVMAGDV